MPAPTKPEKPVVRPDYLAFGRPDFGEEEIAAVTRVLRSGWIGMGPEVIAFEQELSAYVGAPHVVTVNSCTSALHLALLVNGVGPGDEVIVPSLTWCSTANAALYLGAKPVFCDVTPETLNVSPELVLKCLTKRTKAVIAVHFGGLAVDVASLRAALPPNIVIVEDAAHALGATYPDGRPVGSSGNAVCFSFYANKNLSTAEGGAIALTDPAQAERLRSLRQHGLPANAWMRFTHPREMPSHQLNELGFKMNFTDLQAALGRVQLRRQSNLGDRRMAIAGTYFHALESSGLGWQEGALASHHARHLLAVQLPLGEGALSRDEFVLALRRRNIGASIHYAPLHRMEIYAVNGAADLPKTDLISARLFTLPISSHMTTEDAANVADHVLDLLSPR